MSRSRWVIPALALLGTLAGPRAARADFKITYLFTDADGQPLRNRPLLSRDMSSYSNLASCQCGHLWGALVLLDNSVGTAYTSDTYVDTYVGYNCGDGQEGVSVQDGPCVKVLDGTANDYDDGGILISFEQVWLSSRSETRDQLVGDATPVLPCDASQTGGGGIWICVESNGQSNCQREEFVVQGDQSTNGGGTGGGTGTGTDPTGMDAASGNNIQFDYTPPQANVAGFRAEPGDGAVVISWDSSEPADVSGFRVLCADMDGNAPGNGVTTIPEGSDRTNGKLYYTAENLCGDTIYTSETGTGSDGASDTGGSSSGADSGAVTDSGAASMSTSAEGPTRDPTTPTGFGSSGGTAGSDGSGSALESLDWRYVCSDHVTSTGTEARVDGLENGKEYQFLVVAYDAFGNPKIMSDVLTATPIETSDFWEQCEQQGDLCGSGGFCSCTSAPPPAGAAWLGTGLLLLGLARRRKGSAA
jgi:MYXO-CTERM domain-containing protein